MHASGWVALGPFQTVVSRVRWWFLPRYDRLQRVELSQIPIALGRIEVGSFESAEKRHESR
jgi:hypothetical protein